MPFQIDYTEPQTQINYPESFWLISAVNLNQLTLVATVTFDGFPTVNEFNIGNGRIAQQQFVFNSAEDYQRLLEFQFESRNTIYSFYALVEMAVNEISDFFVGGGYTQYSIYRPATLEVGAESETRVNVVFSGNEITGVADGAGVTIVSGFTITSADLVGGYTDRAFYDLDRAVLPGENVFFTYNSALGFMQDAQLLPLRNFGGDAPYPFLHTVGMVVTNYVGRSAKFNMSGNSGLIGAVV